ncbi:MULTISPECIES: ATP-grasp domain-containing protein [unclassified Providencia]|uniref:ATP-grasp domain-containing protein n=1 Tax=unclassified Providencia TaxID=2633465 RepID=UPI00234BF75D|nr:MULTISPECIES: ATP-grasp domain-containing protein [unclassified Providencia]
MNILLTSVGRRTYLIDYFKDALREFNSKVFAANSVKTYAITQADSYTITPEIYSDNYIEYLLKYCKDNQIKIVISLFDIDLPILAKNKELFSNIGVRVIISSPDVIDICNDKWKTYNFLLDSNIPTPKTFLSLPFAEEEIKKNSLVFPLIVKPRWGMGSIGIYKAETIDELNIFYKKVKNEIQSTYLKYESALDIDKSVLIQQYISGNEYGLEIINDLDGNYITTLCKQKVAMRSGETDQALTINNPALHKLGELLSRELGHVCILDTDCLEENGKFYILEMNARFGGQYPFSHLAGAHIPKQIIEWISNGQTKNEYVTIKENVLCCKDIKPTIIENN